MRAKLFIKKLDWEREWKQPLVSSVYISIGNLIIITTLSKKLLKTRISFKNLQNRKISWQSKILGG